MLIPRITSLTSTLVHDDTTFAHDTPPTPDEAPLTLETCPLALAISLFTTILWNTMRCRLAGRKTIIFQPPLPLDHPLRLANYPHLLPNKTTFTDTHFRLAGTDVGTPDGLYSATSMRAHAYHTFLQSFLRQLG